MLKIKDLRVTVEDKEILAGVNLEVKGGEVHVLMGPNGSGKSTLAQALMGNPNYEITEGSTLLGEVSLAELEPDERSKAGLFLSFQYPSVIPGLNIASFLKLIYNKKNNLKLSPAKFRKILKEKMDILEIPEDFMDRYLNEGFSGGEKKRLEMLQMLILEPKVVILDETDSGLDIDALKIVSRAVNHLREKNNMSVLLITHYTRILQHIKADKVSILRDGKIIREGGRELADELEAKGYAPFGE